MTGYVAHHNAPQYFGYVANNPQASTHLHGLSEFFDAMCGKKQLPASGVFYVRGGYGNIRGWKPQDPNPKLAEVFSGNDDHPGYSDTQISEALLAEEINAIAASPYWSQSAIIITYDESDGLYDHAQPRIRSHDANGLASGAGAAHSGDCDFALRGGAWRLACAVGAQLDHQICGRAVQPDSAGRPAG